MTRVEIAKLIKESSAGVKKFMFVSSGYVDSPFISKFATLNKHEYNAAYYSVYSLAANPAIHYVSVLSLYKDTYTLKCGDAYLEGTLSDGTLKNLINVTLEKAQSTNKSLPSLLQANYNTAPRSSACTFNQKNYEQVDFLCEHISNFLANLPKDVLSKLYTNYHKTLYGINDGKVSPELQMKFKRYAFKKHILLEGDKGSGKTYTATSWVKENNFTQIFIGGHEQFESIDFLGHYIQQKSGELVWKDGALSEAYRKAALGKKVVVIIDEILRIPKRELNLLISALSPIDGSYTLRTGRAESSQNGIAKEEVLLAPAQNLWVIGTTNVGAAYAVESMDEALSDRFKPIRKDTTEEELRKILLSTVQKRNFSNEHVEKLMQFYIKMKRLYTTNILTKIVNIRQLCEAIEIATHQNEIKEIIKDSLLLWVERDLDGRPNSEQVLAVKSVIGKVYV